MTPSGPADWYFDKHARWEPILRQLRAMVLDAQLVETVKWGCPCYTLDGRNVVLMHAFKEYCALLFMKGALIQDSLGVLVQQTDNVQSARQIRFASLDDLATRVPAVQACLVDAIAVEKSGAQVQKKPTAAFGVAEEFADRLVQLPALKMAFDALTPGRQRAYLLHFSSAKQSKTRVARIEKCTPRILEGKGLDDE